MKKTVAIAFLYLVATLALQARTPRLEFGVEWGYCPALFYWNHLEYLTDDQYFIRSKGRDWTYTSNGMAIIYAGLDINSRAVIRLHAGYQGVDRGLRTIPVGLQAAYYFAGTSSQGWLTFVIFDSLMFVVIYLVLLFKVTIIRIGPHMRYSIEYHNPNQCNDYNPNHISCFTISLL